MDILSSEMVKYASNNFLATKISFINEMAEICERLGADVEQVAEGMGLDRRIGRAFLNAGAGYGGSCFPKDVQALVRSSRDVGHTPEILNAVEAVNKRQKQVLFEKLRRHFGDSGLNGRTVALWGLAFKPNTDDMREAPSRTLIDLLTKAGVSVKAFDPVAGDEALRIYGNNSRFQLARNSYEAAEGADALVIVTEWQEFRSPDFERLKKILKSPLIFDGRNLYDPAMVGRFGLTYYAIGRGKSLPPA
jgi:UDPglucose 6-dehydrogenase